ncbi:MAG: hypothetical protein GY940_25585 [bacterium]|nr:hypothetical protein [bacterium]
MTKFKALTLSFLLIMCTAGLFPNGLNFNSIGSKASSMGTAFVGLADDYAAILMNPAGLTQMEKPTLSIFFTTIIPDASYNFELLGATFADTGSIENSYPSGTFAYFHPVSDKVVVGLGAFVPSGAGARWPGADLALLSGGTEYTWHSKIFTITVAPVIAIKLTDNFSVGAALNVNFIKLIMERPGGGETTPFFQYEERETGIGIGATLGIMYKPNDTISLGATFRAPVKATVDGTTKIPFLTALSFPGESASERTATWPTLAAVGIAVTPNDKLTITADIQYTNWKQWDSVPIEFAEASWKAIGLEEASEFTFNWDDTVDFKFGVEYKVTPKLALRAGYYVDGSPAPTDTLNIMLPSTDYKVVTFGFGYKAGRLNIDFGFEYLSGEDRFVNPLNYLVGSGMPGTHGMNIIVPNVAFTYEF